MKEKVLFLDTNRLWYNPKQFGYSMTVDDLIDYLSGFDPNTRIYFRNDGGYTYGRITESEISDEIEIDH